MNTLPHTKNKVTAISLMAVLFVALFSIGCVTPQRMENLEAQIRTVESQNRDLMAKLESMESTVTQGEDGNRVMRADVSSSVEEISSQLSSLQEQFNDLMQKVDAIYRATHDRKVLIGSSGSSSTPNPPRNGGTTTQEPSFDCSAAYDDAFILVRQGEYQNAIDAFKTFVEECKSHELVENAMYWTGEAFYSLEKYDLAIAEFRHLIGTYKSSLNTSRALYKLGRSSQELGKKDDAKMYYKRLVDEFGGTLEAEQANERLKELK